MSEPTNPVPDALPPVAVVTGAAQGIGERIAEVLGAAGFRLALLDRQLVTRPDALTFAGDVTDEADVDGFAAAVDEAYGRVDVLVNNARIACIAPAEDTPPALRRQVLDVNLPGPVLLSQAVGRRVLAQGSGSVLNTA